MGSQGKKDKKPVSKEVEKKRQEIADLQQRIKRMIEKRNSAKSQSPRADT